MKRLILFVFFAGCTSPSPSTDAGHSDSVDAAASGFDASIALDASSPIDAAMVPDAAMRLDASVPRDAAVIPDAAMIPDAAVTTDATLPELDAGEEPDAATSDVPDAAMMDAPDAGPPPNPVMYLGVVYFPSLQPDVDRVELQRIIDELGSGQPRHAGANYDVQLVVQTDVSWAETEPVHGAYDFSKYLEFGALVRELGLTWTPLLSYHYAPSWVETETISAHGSSPRLVNAQGMPASSFMPFSPSSPVWSELATPWTTAAVNAFRPLMGDVVNVIFCGNEMTYDITQPSSYDAYTLAAWRSTLNDQTASLPVGMASDTRWQSFRAQQWKNMLSGLVGAAKNAAMGGARISTKLVPYEMASTRTLRTGIFPNAFNLLDDLDVIGIDAYPPTSPALQVFFRDDKDTYLSEFNNQDNTATHDDVVGWLRDGIQNYRVRYATFFSWNGAPYVMTDEQKRAFSDVIPFIQALPRIASRPNKIQFVVNTWVLSHDADDAWGLHPDDAARLNGPYLLTDVLGKRAGISYYVDHRQNPTARIRILHFTSNGTLGSYGSRVLAFMQEPGVNIDVLAFDGYVRTASAGGDSSSRLDRATLSLPIGTQVFGWSPAWSAGTRTLETDSQYELMAAAPDGAKTLIHMDRTYVFAQDVLWLLANAPELPVATLIGDIVSELDAL